MPDLRCEPHTLSQSPLVTAGAELRALAVAKVRVQVLRPRGCDRPAADPAMLPQVPNTAIGSDPCALWGGPDDWIVYSQNLDGNALHHWVSEIATDAPLVATDVSGATSVLELRGMRAVYILMRDCTLDLDGDAVPLRGCAQTLLAQTTVLIHRSAQDTWRVFVERSAASHVWDWLVDTAGPPPSLERA